MRCNIGKGIIDCYSWYIVEALQQHSVPLVKLSLCVFSSYGLVVLHLINIILKIKKKKKR